MTNVWQDLTYDNILNSVENTLGEKLSNLCLRRNSYINRVFELEKYDSRERFIIKFYRPGRWTPDMIKEEHDFVKKLFEREIPVIPPLSIDGQTLFPFSASPIRYTLFPKKSGRPIDEFDEEGWLQIGRLLARIHLVGETYKSSQRIVWEPQTATAHHLETLLKNDFIPADFNKAFTGIAEEFIKKADPCFKNIKKLLIHGDCHKGNFIHRPDEGIYIVDFDDMCFGPAVQDVWMLLPDILERSQNEIGWLIDGYETFRSFPQEELELLPYLRGMRIIHYASWFSVQCKEPDFSNNFPEMLTPRYWNGIIKDLQGIVYGDTRIS